MTDTKKRSRAAYEATHYRVLVLSDEKQAEMLRWMLREHADTGALEHAKRYLHRCSAPDCTEVPRTVHEIDTYADNECPRCSRFFCADHYENSMRPGCSNEKCSESGDLVCEQCSHFACEECEEPLCFSCYDVDGACQECRKK